MLNLPLTSPVPAPVVATPTKARRHVITLKLLFIAVLVLLLQAPLALINNLRHERLANNGGSDGAAVTAPTRAAPSSYSPVPTDRFEPYRMVERSLKHSVLVLALVFAAFFLFETLVGLRLHAVHYGLVGAALCLFYLALLALGEVLPPGQAYLAAATASSLLITLYSSAILHSRTRAGIITLLLAGVHGVLYIVLRMEFFALLAGTAALFAALAAVMFFTRNVDWRAQDNGTAATA